MVAHSFLLSCLKAVMLITLWLHVTFSGCIMANTLLWIDVKEVGFFAYLANLTLLVCIPIILGMYFTGTSRLNSTFSSFQTLLNYCFFLLVYSHLYRRISQECSWPWLSWIDMTLIRGYWLVRLPTFPQWGNIPPTFLICWSHPLRINILRWCVWNSLSLISDRV